MNDQEMLEALVRHAAQRREKGAFKLHDNDGYLRVNGSGYRAVSVHPKSPLCQFSSSGTPDLDEALAHFRNRPREIASLESHPRPERQLQAHLIREALRHDGDLLAALGPGLPFDRLLFAVDEVPLDGGAIRCDMLAVGIRGKVATPVLIELKYGRLLKELVDQLGAFEELVWRHDAAFRELLGVATGAAVSMDHLHFLIVWPKAGASAGEGSQRTRKALELAGALAVGFTKDPQWHFEVEVGRAHVHERRYIPPGAAGA
jgi:hypothetical protein